MDAEDKIISEEDSGRGMKRKCPFASLLNEVKTAHIEDIEEGELSEDSLKTENEPSTVSQLDNENLASKVTSSDSLNNKTISDSLKAEKHFCISNKNEAEFLCIPVADSVSDSTPVESLSKTPVTEPVSNDHDNISPSDVPVNESNEEDVPTSTVNENASPSDIPKDINGQETVPGEQLPVFLVISEYDGASETEANKDENSSDSDISDEEIEAMLEEGLKNKVNTNVENLKDGQQKPVHYTEKKLVMLEELGINHFDLLPEGWVQITHKSGMPLYLHRASRVCTFSRPYYLGQGSARKHLVPLSAIPCLQYKRALEEERKSKEEESNPNTSPIWLRPAKIETVEENKLTQSLGPFAIQQYCKTLFRFKIAQTLRFVSWSDRRRYAKARRIEKQQRPTFPNDTKLIKFPILNPNDGPDAKPRGEWIMNPNGKSYICILHEYVQHALKMQPTYEFKALENPSTPYSATVIIGGMKYGYGTGTSKKQAKLAAAKASLEILIPQMRQKIRNDTKQGKKCRTDDDEASLSIFDEIKIEDPRVTEFCTKTTEPSPYSILLTCLQRNFDLGEMAIEYKVNSLHRQSNEFVMTVGSHTARVVCKKKMEGKQRASQALLQKLHPHITSWGSLLRLYGNRSLRNVKEKKQEEQEITMLQSKASLNSPNYAILDKLKTEMTKLHDEMAKRKPISIFVPPPDIVLPSSGTQLNKIDL